MKEQKQTLDLHQSMCTPRRNPPTSYNTIKSSVRQSDPTMKLLFQVVPWTSKLALPYIQTASQTKTQIKKLKLWMRYHSQLITYIMPPLQNCALNAAENLSFNPIFTVFINMSEKHTTENFMTRSRWVFQSNSKSIKHCGTCITKYRSDNRNSCEHEHWETRVEGCLPILQENSLFRYLSMYHATSDTYKILIPLSFCEKRH